jgi:hypothetical protein
MFTKKGSHGMKDAQKETGAVLRFHDTEIAGRPRLGRIQLCEETWR